MSAQPSRQDGRFDNRLLDALSASDRRRIRPLLSAEQVELRQLLYAPGAPIEAVYFPIDAVACLLTTMSGGTTVEIATVGTEGMVGSRVVLGADVMPPREFCQVQVPGRLWRMDRAAFSEMLSASGRFRDIVQGDVLALFSQIAQQVACNALHSVEERCCRWLLSTHDRVRADTFPLTQEFLAQMLGVRRASVTVAAGALQAAGLIRYRRGQITIVDRAGLEGASCECYQLLRDEFDRLFGSTPTTSPGAGDRQTTRPKSGRRPAGTSGGKRRA